jgi:hypothetical protein
MMTPDNDPTTTTDHRNHLNENDTMMNRMILSNASELDAKPTDETNREQTTATPQTSGRGRAAVRRIIVILFMLALAATGSRAQSTVSITASPVHLTQSIAQFTGEVKLIDMVSAAGVIGFGRRDGENIRFGGGQIRFYLTGGFDGGVHIGAEALYSQLGNARSIDGFINLMNGAAAGPFIGYKHVLPFGLTIDVQGGLRYAEEAITSGTDATDADNFGPLANINVGWSF